MNMMHPTTPASRPAAPCLPLLTVLIGCLLAAPLRAQSSTAPEKSGDQPVVLSPFTVTTSGDVGYQAESSLSGSRLSTKLTDLAAPTTAFTQEFLNDIASTSVDDLASYMVSARTNSPEGVELYVGADSHQIRIRGLPAYNYSVNFFESTLRLDSYNTERIEQSRGPNSILFGLGSPGGVINVATKRAVQNKTFGTVSQQARSNNGWRTAVDYNQVVVPDKLSLRLDAVRDFSDGWRYHEYDHQQRLYLTADWQISANTRLDVEAEHGLVDKSFIQPSVGADAYSVWADAGKHLSNTPNTAWGIQRISAANWAVVDTATGQVMDWKNKTTSVPYKVGGVQAYITDFSLLPKDVTLYAGPAFPQTTNYSRASAFLSHAFTPDLNLEFAANAQRARHDSMMGRGYNLLQVDTNTTLPTGAPNPHAGQPYVEGFPGLAWSYDRNENLRFSIAYNKDLGRWGTHQLAALYERDWIWQKSGQSRISIVNNPYNKTSSDNGSNSLRFRTYVDLNGPADAITAGDWRSFNPTSFTDLTSGRVMGAHWSNWAAGGVANHFVRDSAIGILQSHFFDNRLVTVVGYRQDRQASYYSPTGVRGDPYGDFTLGDYVITPSDTAVINRAHNTTYSALYHVTKWLALTYNRAENAALPDPVAAVVGADGTGRPPAPRGKTQDYGIKVNLGPRLSLNALYYETSAQKDTANSNAAIEGRFPVIWQALNAAGVAAPDGGSALDVPSLFNRHTFDSAAKGYEVELIANITDNWRLFFNYSSGWVKQTNIGQEAQAYLAKYQAYWTQGDRARIRMVGSGTYAPVADNVDAVIDTVGEQVTDIVQEIHDLYILPDGQLGRGEIKDQINLFTNYSFGRGTLEGFSVGGGARYRSGEVTSYDVSSGSTAITYGSPNTLVDFKVGYNRRARLFGHNVRWDLQLNVRNLLDETQILPMREVGGVVTNYRLQSPREFILTAKLGF